MESIIQLFNIYKKIGEMKRRDGLDSCPCEKRMPDTLNVLEYVVVFSRKSFQVSKIICISKFSQKIADAARFFFTGLIFHKILIILFCHSERKHICFSKHLKYSAFPANKFGRHHAGPVYCSQTQPQRQDSCNLQWITGDTGRHQGQIKCMYVIITVMFC